MCLAVRLDLQKSMGSTVAKPHPWPILSKVQVFSKNELIDTGVALGDPPGLADNNSDIVKATEGYLACAGQILVFTPLQRATNNPGLDMHIRRCIRAHSVHQIYTVVTGIDAVSPVQRENWSDLPPDDAHQVRLGEAMSSETRASEKDTSRAKESALANSDYKLFAHLDKKL